MNKKRLSVVMAGAMLASSVAPVLAAESYEVNGSNKGILIRDLRNLLTKNVFENVDSNKLTTDYRGTSVYKVEINGNKYYTVSESGVTGIKALEDAINNAPAGTEVKVYDRGHATKDGKNYAYALEDMVVGRTFSETELKAIAKEFTDNSSTAQAKYKSIINATYKDGVLTVVTRKATDDVTLSTFTYKAGEKAVDFTKPLAGENSLEQTAVGGDWSGLTGYKEAIDTIVKEGKDIPEELLATVTISNATSKETLKLSDLYDGLFLTEKGQDLLTLSKEYRKVTGSSAALKGKKFKWIKAINRDKNGLYTFNLELVTYEKETANAHGTVLENRVITISSNNEAKLELIRNWFLNEKAAVEVLAGDNRYETAVKVAKENASIEDVAVNGNIVLVNGDSLVDGLAAAPLAAAVWNKNNGTGAEAQRQRVAPILLTESDSLPKATKDYIKELIAEQQVGKLHQVTIYLVGGTTVISKSLENQLKEYGLRVVRAGGANREETSLKVAEVMAKDGDIISGSESNNNGTVEKVDLSHAFVVGADGEADAMSIAPVAAEKGNPIIVSKKGGLSEDAIDTLNGWKNNTNGTNNTISATIIGGETVVSKSTENTLKAKGMQVERIAGSNRQATNAAVISRYAKKGFNRVVVSKDGQNKKGDLIDALTATSLAVKDKAPIVLGTNKLSLAQINSMEQKSVRTGVYVYQVGYGVARDVVKTIADRVGLAK